MNTLEEQLSYFRKKIMVEYPCPRRLNYSPSYENIFAFIVDHVGTRYDYHTPRDLEIRFFRGILSFEDLCYIIGVDSMECELWDFRYFKNGRKLNPEVVITEFSYK